VLRSDSIVFGLIAVMLFGHCSAEDSGEAEEAAQEAVSGP
jgi:hypothetical protein